MMVSELKPIEEILGFLEGEERIFLLGCNGCAAASKTGDEQSLRPCAGAAAILRQRRGIGVGQ